MSATWIRVVVESDKDRAEKVIGQALVSIDVDVDPERDAKLFLQAWDDARASAERTLRMYGAEGLWRALLADGGTATPEPTA